MPRTRVVVEVPFLPLHVLERYDMPEHLSLPTKASRKRVLAEQDDGSPWKLKLTPSKRKRGRALSSDSGFGGYGDDSDDLRDEDEVENWESDGSSSDGINARRPITRQTGRMEPQVMRTRSHRTPRSPVASNSKRTHSTAARSTITPAVRAQSQLRANSPKRARGASSDVDSCFEEDEGDQQESDYSSSEMLVPRLTKPPTRKILQYHRHTCEKCAHPPADVLLQAARRKKKGKGKRRKETDEFVVDDEEYAESLGGWLECERCCSSFHWSCIPQGQRKKVMLALNSASGGSRIHTLPVDDVASFLCSRCEAFPVCFVCKERKVHGSLENTHGAADDPIDVDEDGDSQARSSSRFPRKPRHTSASQTEAESASNLIKSDPAPLLFRCKRCKQACHYEHLRSPFPVGQRYSLPRLADAYQHPAPDGGADWECHVCRDLPWFVDRIIAWRPFPADAIEPDLEPEELPNYRDRLPREYLVKWTARGFRHSTWVPHGWLVAVAPQKLRNFIEKGPQLDLVTDDTLAAKGDETIAPTITAVMEELNATARHHREKDVLEAKWEGHGPPPDPDAQANLPLPWCTVDRVLDVWLAPPKNVRKFKTKGKKEKRKRVISSGSDEDELDDDVVLRDGIQPPTSAGVWIDDWEELTGRMLTRDDLDEIAPLVTWSFVKWRDLQYDQACGDTPPPVDGPLYPAYKEALGRHLDARLVTVPILTQKECAERERFAENFGDPPAEQPDCVVGGTLMPFQVEGFQWLLYKHFRREGCILADDMGLGKTIQVASFLGYLASDELQIYPSLVIVPNSTITNWVREFERWVPHVRVVPYYGESGSRHVIAKYELYRPSMERKAAGLKAQVLLTTYDTITGSDFSIFSNIPRWEVLVVDEGQAVKNDSSLLFRKLKKLNAIHRVLLTGTPLNNNLRELFNLLNFLDAANFPNLKELEERFEDLNESLVVELHEMLKPYILRRVKGDVLKLPPKVEIIVPISMTAPQRHLYKRILLKHREAINAIMKQRKRKQPKQVAAPETDQPQASSSADADKGAAQASEIEIIEVADGDVEMADADTSAPDQDNPDVGPSVNGSANGHHKSATEGSKAAGRTDATGANKGASTKPHLNGTSQKSASHLSPPMDLD
ncbi:hypothetical protein CC85DRAFT_293493 [Cutaneotrichosporon oleaginosum]|uniref:Helicase ATP-binding domain-containing protein n=1 Tax=Cutaneotrichosporon oleaginosum TaxID=879819 RepID=A0A0J1AXD4_9TREE|nr:uncharacterized protein CC85DRAFT_293493 [Cutaneotrichosporon oleaginosum]KLT39969.1 hypothetical protein CC85DRAFT_293493 [Cutaneotrichosporon oleaginosum]TXT14158.1 hypothetical protein COLE_00351 [Cutaneotrichosporon oleaginosum]